MVTTTEIRPISQRQEIYDSLTARAEHLGIKATLLTHRAKMSDGHLYLLIHIGNAVDAYDEATKLEELESSWNDQEPEPHPRVFLLPADESDNPGWAQDYVLVQRETDRYFEAFDAFRAAVSPEEMHKALKDMEDAKMTELEASRQMSLAA